MRLTLRRVKRGDVEGEPNAKLKQLLASFSSSSATSIASAS